MTTATQRLQTAGKKIGLIALLCAGAAGAMLVFHFFYPIGQAVRDSDGLIGFVFGVITVGGVTVANVAVWIATGQSLMDRLLGF